MSVCVVCPTYNGVERLDYMMLTVKQNDQDVLKKRWLVVEDPCDRLAVTAGYEDICYDCGMQFIKLNEWSNMHGAAKKAFNAAIYRFDPDWIIYLGDDLAITPHSLTQMIYFLENNALETVGLVQFPYWNSHEYRPDDPKDEWFYRSTDWTRNVPINPHWNQHDHAFPYVNVNGAGFACRASMYRDVGGFAEGTWCLDESISWRCWTQSPYSVVALPGQPYVHFFGASLLANPPRHDMWLDSRWTEAIGHTKPECDRIMREKMAEREKAVVEEMKAAKYYAP